jgi:thioredoxin-related protein
MRTFVIGLLCLIGLPAFSQSQAKRTVAKPPVDSSLFYKDTVVKWMTIEEAEAMQKVKPKKILVDVYTKWCRWCRVADSLDYRNREIAHYINQNFYAVKFNAENKKSCTYKGVRYDFEEDESLYVHSFARYVLNGKQSYPGTAFIDENGHLIKAETGYMEAPYFEAVLNYYGSDSYKKMSYNNFEDEFVGKIEEE